MKFSFFNNTKQKYHSDQIYFVITGLNASHQTCQLDKNGALIPCKVSDNDAPGHLTKNGEKRIQKISVTLVNSQLDLDKTIVVDDGIIKYQKQKK